MAFNRYDVPFDETAQYFRLSEYRYSPICYMHMHYYDFIMSAIASQITSFTIVYSIVYSDADQRKLQSSASLAFVQGIHRWPGNSPHIWPVTRKMFPFDDVIMDTSVNEPQYTTLAFCSRLKWMIIPHTVKRKCCLLTTFASLTTPEVLK